MIRVLNSNPSLNQQQMLVKSNENNFQLSFNNGNNNSNNSDQQNVFASYQNFYMTQDQHVYPTSSANSNNVR